MSEYASVYKCRLCGKTFINDSFSMGRAIGIVGRLTNENSFTQGDVHGSRHTTHNCDDGSLGFSDFQGFKKVGD